MVGLLLFQACFLIVRCKEQLEPPAHSGQGLRSEIWG